MVDVECVKGFPTGSLCFVVLRIDGLCVYVHVCSPWLSSLLFLLLVVISLSLVFSLFLFCVPCVHCFPSPLCFPFPDMLFGGSGFASALFPCCCIWLSLLLCSLVFASSHHTVFLMFVICPCRVLYVLSLVFPLFPPMYMASVSLQGPARITCGMPFGPCMRIHAMILTSVYTQKP